MPLHDVLAASAVLPALKAQNKKQVLQELAACAARLCGRDERELFDILLQRERLGSTAIGRGVAIPHGKVAGLDRLLGAFARLARPVDFAAVDGEPVDLVFLLLAPVGAGADHLKALAQVARLLRDERLAETLRAARGADALYLLLTDPPASHAA